MAHIEVLYGKQPERTIQLDTDRLVIGRGVGAHVVLKHDTVSRVHCEIIQRHGQHYVRDLMSTNQLQRGDETVPAALLRNGDKVAVGAFFIRYRTADAPGWTESAAPAAKQHWPGLGDEPERKEVEGVQVASELNEGAEDGVAEKYKSTSLANPKQLARIRKKVSAEQGAHIKVKMGREMHTVALARLPFKVGCGDGHNLTLPGKPLLGRTAFEITKEGDSYLIERGSFWISLRAGGKTVRKSRWLDDGDWIRTRGFSFRFWEGA